MKRFKSIAVLLGEGDDIQAVLDRAHQLAVENQAVMSVYASAEISFDRDVSESPIGPEKEVAGWIRNNQRLALEGAIAPYQDRGAAVSGELLEGKAFVRLIQEVLRKGHDLVMLAAERGSSATSFFFGGTAAHLLRKCPCVVWVFRHQPGRPFHRIMAAVNADTQRPEEIQLNRKIMELAASLADREQAELHIISCWTAFAESMLVNMGNLSGDNLDQYLVETKIRHRTLLHSLLDDLPLEGERLHIHQPKGEAGELIPETVDQVGIDLLVMGTVARTGIPGFFIGNTAEKILNRLPCSLLAVKPDGFVSPVTLSR